MERELPFRGDVDCDAGPQIGAAPPGRQKRYGRTDSGGTEVPVRPLATMALISASLWLVHWVSYVLIKGRILRR